MRNGFHNEKYCFWNNELGFEELESRLQNVNEGGTRGVKTEIERHQIRRR